MALDALNDLILSPPIFGDYAHGLQAGQILGYTPSTLNLEVYANFSVNTAAEGDSGFGLSTGSGLTATNHIAFIYSNGTLFTMRGTPGTGAYTDTGAAKDNAFHLFKIVATAGGTVEWFIDGSTQGKMDVQAALWPCSFGGYSSTTNRFSMARAPLL